LTPERTSSVVEVAPNLFAIIVLLGTLVDLQPQLRLKRRQSPINKS
jgi:hypothetical protein